MLCPVVPRSRASAVGVRTHPFSRPLLPLQGDELLAKVRAAKVLVVGAGGIGCELLKNLVLTGFEDLEVRGARRTSSWRASAPRAAGARAELPRHRRHAPALTRHMCDPSLVPPHLQVIDLDTIDVSNLNRQFLFRPHHVGKPKAVVAREAVLAFNPAAKIVAYHA